MELNFCRELAKKISAAEKRLALLREQSAGVSSTRLDGLPKAKPLTSRVEHAVIKISEAERELADLRRAFEQSAGELAEKIIERVDTRAASVLLLRYAACLPFQEICARLKITKDVVFKLHARGKRQFELVGKRHEAG